MAVSQLTSKDLETVSRAFGGIFRPKDMFQMAEDAEYRLKAGER